jgi:hypothetical protein
MAIAHGLIEIAKALGATFSMVVGPFAYFDKVASQSFLHQTSGYLKSERYQELWTQIPNEIRAMFVAVIRKHSLFYTIPL